MNPVSLGLLEGDWGGRGAKGCLDGETMGEQLATGEGASDSALRADTRGEEWADDVGALAGTYTLPPRSIASAWLSVSSMVDNVGTRGIGLRITLLKGLSGLSLIPLRKC